MAALSTLMSQWIKQFGFVPVSLACCAIAACTPTPPSPSASQPTASVVANAPSSSPAANSTAPKNAQETFAAIIGTQKDGWLPKEIANKGLKKNQTPEEVGKIVPGAEKVSEFGFSQVPVSDIAGLKQYEFYFAKNDSGKPTKLEGVRLQFDPAMNDAYSDLVKVLIGKYGDAPPEDVKKEMIVWVGPDFGSAQLTKQPTGFGSYELNVSISPQ